MARAKLTGWLAQWRAGGRRQAGRQAGRRSGKLEDGRVTSALEMSEVQERPGGELKLGLAEASAEDQRALLRSRLFEKTRTRCSTSKWQNEFEWQTVCWPSDA